LEALHPVSSQLIKRAYDSIDTIYQDVARILDRHGIIAQQRMLYRCFTEELWKLSQKYRGKTLYKMVRAVDAKYEYYDLDPNILGEIKQLFGIIIPVEVSIE